MHLLNIILAMVTVALLIPVAVFCGECLLAMLPGRRRNRAEMDRPRIAVLMPAHNEAAGVAASIKTVARQLQPQDRLIVIADNCTDTTAAVAQQCGATVVQRTDSDHRGKGYALDAGVRHLELDPPQIVLMMDCDCTAEPGMVDALATQVMATGRSAQAMYLMEQPANPVATDLVSALAFTVKNWVRPIGLSRIGLPCVLTGSGMAFPWEAIRNVNLATGNIVEDMQLGIDLTIDRQAPFLCEAARVTGRLPETTDAAAVQRRRWEHGHLRTLLTQVPRLLRTALWRGDFAAAAIALDLVVPPLSLLVALIFLAMLASSLAAAVGASWVFAVALGSAWASVILCVVGAWAKYARKTLPLRSLLTAPFYLIGKIPIYAAFIFHREQNWHRTDRTSASSRSTARRHPRTGQRRPASTQPRATVQLANIAVDAVTERQCIDRILAGLEQGRGGVVITPNIDHLRRCARDPEYATMLAAADLVVADGMPLVWASKLQGTPLPGRVAGSDLISSLSAAACALGRSIFLLGGAPGAAEATAKVLRERHPAIRLAGVYCPPLGFENDAEVLPEMLDRLRVSSPDIVFVALGSPKQEKFISTLRDKLPRTWWLGVGYSFSFLSGQAQRAPQWMQQNGLEWAHRLLQDPTRLAKRYLWDGFPFAASLMSGAMVRGVSGWFRRMPDAGQHDQIEPALSLNNVDLPLPYERTATPQIIYQSFLSDALTISLENRVVASGRNRRARPVTRGALDRLRAVVVLSGSIRPSVFSMAIGRSMLDLPLDGGRSLLTHWHGEVRGLRRSLELAELPLVVMVGHASPIPMPPRRNVRVPIRIERDRSSYRGTGGVVRDYAVDFDDDDLILVANAAQVLMRPLIDLAQVLADSEADASFIAPRDAMPSGVMLVRCAALRAIAPVGYVDMKEQALPEMAKRYTVVPVPQMHAPGLPIRSLDEYLSALQYQHRQSLAKPIKEDSFGDEHCPSFSVIERGAVVHPSARIHDSVVLRNARVDADAVVVRSVVCPGGVLKASATAIDEVVLNETAA